MVVDELRRNPGLFAILLGPFAMSDCIGSSRHFKDSFGEYFAAFKDWFHEVKPQENKGRLAVFLSFLLVCSLSVVDVYAVRRARQQALAPLQADKRVPTAQLKEVRDENAFLRSLLREHQITVPVVRGSKNASACCNVAYSVQVGAYRDRASAQKEIQRLCKDYPSVGTYPDSTDPKVLHIVVGGDQDPERAQQLLLRVKKANPEFRGPFVVEIQSDR